MDLFYVRQFAYLICVTRVSSWFILYHLKPGHATTSKLILICQILFHIYGAPEEHIQAISEIPKNMLCEAQTIFSSISQISKSRAELAVRTTKKIVNSNTEPQCSLDNDKVAKAILITITLLSKVLVSPLHNSYFTVDFVTSFLHNLFSTGHTLNG